VFNGCVVLCFASSCLNSLSIRCILSAYRPYGAIEIVLLLLLLLLYRACLSGNLFISSQFNPVISLWKRVLLVLCFQPISELSMTNGARVLARWKHIPDGGTSVGMSSWDEFDWKCRHIWSSLRVCSSQFHSVHIYTSKGFWPVSFHKSGLPCLLEFLLENFQDLESPEKWPWSFHLLGSDADGSFWLQIDVFLETKIAIIVASSYVFWPTVSISGFFPLCYGFFLSVITGHLSSMCWVVWLLRAVC